MTYYRAVCSFFAWLDQHGIGGLVDIEPFHVAAYIRALKVSDAGNPAVKERAAARTTVKQHLAAIRLLFDWLIVGQILAINPAHAVRRPKHVIKRGKTPVLTEEQARRLLETGGPTVVHCPHPAGLHGQAWPADGHSPTGSEAVPVLLDQWLSSIKRFKRRSAVGRSSSP